MAGVNVYAEKYNSAGNSLDININHLVTGTYLLVVSDGVVTRKTRIIKQ
jgi:hypothetical protein